MAFQIKATLRSQLKTICAKQSQYFPLTDKLAVSSAVWTDPNERPNSTPHFVPQLFLPVPPIPDDRDSAFNLEHLVQLLRSELKDSPLVRGVDKMESATGFRPNWKAIKSGLLYEKVVFQLDPQQFYRDVFQNLRDMTHFRAAHLDYVGTKPKNMTIDFSSPNIAKPFHVGHLRSTIIGNAICNFLTYYGHQVTKINYLGDWGTQFGLLALGFSQFGDPEKLQSDPLSHLLDVYIKSNAKAEEDEAFRDQAKDLFNELESGSNTAALEQWKQFKSLTIAELSKLYSKLNISFDHYDSESMYAQKAKQICQDLLAKGIAFQTEADSSIQFKTGNRSIPLMKSDGSTLYLSRDLAAALDRKQRFNFDTNLYVVGNDQATHFAALKKVLAAYGCEWADKCVHIKYGKILGLSTRRGEVVLLSDIMQEAHERCKESMRESETTKTSAEQDADQFERVSFQLAVSGLIVQDLRYRQSKDYNFSWENALNQAADSGIGLQLAHARICNLEANSEHIKDSNQLDLDALTQLVKSEQASQLLIQLSRFDTVLDEATESYEPSQMVHYLLNLSSFINKAYKVLPVSTESDQDMARVRLQLFRSARGVLAEGMRLIGLSPLSSI